MMKKLFSNVRTLCVGSLMKEKKEVKKIKSATIQRKSYTVAAEGSRPLWLPNLSGLTPLEARL